RARYTATRPTSVHVYRCRYGNASGSCSVPGPMGVPCAAAGRGARVIEGGRFHVVVQEPLLRGRLHLHTDDVTCSSTYGPDDTYATRTSRPNTRSLATQQLATVGSRSPKAGVARSIRAGPPPRKSVRAARTGHCR